MAKVAIQGGVKNYLGDQKTVGKVPIKWKSGPDHPETELAYITKAEKDLLLKKDLHNSLNGKPNRGPEGLMSLNGWGDKNSDGSSDTSGGNAGAEGGQGSGNSNDSYSGGNNNNYSVQDDLFDQSNYLSNNTVTNPSISDQAAKDFFAARPDYKAAADQAAKAKAKQQAEAKKEKDRIDAILAEHRGKEPVAYSYGPKIKDYNKKYFTGPNKFSTATKMRQLALKNLIDKKMGNKKNMPSIFEMGNLFNPSMVDQDYTYNSGITTDMMGANLQDYSDMGKYGLTGKNMTDIDRMNRALDTGRETGEITQQQFEDAFNSQVVPGGGGGNDQKILPYPYNVQQPEEEAEEAGYDYRLGTGGDSADVTRASYDFNQGGRAGKAEGGIMELRARRAFGGIMDRVTGRKAYGLGSIFKSVKKAASKVLKSPIGKAALMYAGGVYLGGGNIFSAGAYNPANFMGSKGYFANMGGGLSNLGKKFGFEKLGEKATFGDKAMKFAKLGLLGYGLTKTPLGEVKPNETSFTQRGERLKNSQGEEGQAAIRNEVQEAYKSGDPQRIAAVQQYYNYMLPSPDAVQDMSLPSSLPYVSYGAAEGGRIGKAEGGLMDLGGMEKDYRAEGGFVPIGEYEKKDDVPARLSVNEFVFTADAVRGAGQGDIDKGAEIMENMMENLENGGTISEESQGKNGAQQMFETSQRLGEVV